MMGNTLVIHIIRMDSQWAPMPSIEVIDNVRSFSVDDRNINVVFNVESGLAGESFPIPNNFLRIEATRESNHE